MLRTEPPSPYLRITILTVISSIARTFPVPADIGVVRFGTFRRTPMSAGGDHPRRSMLSEHIQHVPLRPIRDYPP